MAGLSLAVAVTNFALAFLMVGVAPAPCYAPHLDFDRSPRAQHHGSWPASVLHAATLDPLRLTHFCMVIGSSPTYPSASACPPLPFPFPKCVFRGVLCDRVWTMGVVRSVLSLSRKIKTKQKNNTKQSCVSERVAPTRGHWRSVSCITTPIARLCSPAAP